MSSISADGICSGSGRESLSLCMIILNDRLVCYILRGKLQVATFNG